ncbi:hypothetical protein [Candidatus Pelagibacter sp. Uisw_090]|uniref:hypothetical protein n=1 Tax=Candidatus Pelagibacter sp. Uisw_090 TaxID=3230993 RepID=UPI0039E757B6
MKIIDNFIDPNAFIVLAKVILEAKFPWYFVNGKSELHDGDFQFTHLFVDDGGKIVSKYFKILMPIIRKINPEKIYRIKANLTTKKDSNKKSLMHTDTNIENIKTAVFYCNTNNGSTLFQNGKKISAIANRIVIFDGHQKHCGVDCTDESIRTVININYFEKK